VVCRQRYDTERFAVEGKLHRCRGVEGGSDVGTSAKRRSIWHALILRAIRDLEQATKTAVPVRVSWQAR
jgi:hypothetical protein